MKSIYLAGKIEGLSEKEAMSWRLAVKNELEYNDKICKVNCPKYEYDDCNNLLWDRDYFLLDNSDILLVNFNYDNDSPFLGTSMEIGRAFYQRKPIIIFSTKEWVHKNKTLKYHASAIVKTIDDAIDIIKGFL